MGLVKVINQIKVTMGFVVNMNNYKGNQKLVVPKGDKGLAKITNQVNVAMGFIINKNNADEDMVNTIENQENENLEISIEEPSAVSMDIELKKTIIPIMLIGLGILTIMLLKRTAGSISDEVNLDID